MMSKGLSLMLKLMGAWNWVSQGKCKYYDVCKLRDPTGSACTKDRGQYYNFGRYPGCYRELERKRNE